MKCATIQPCMARDVSDRPELDDRAGDVGSEADAATLSRRMRRLSAPRRGRAAVGERLAGFVYGTLIVLGMIIVGAKAYPDGPGRIAAFVVVTSVVFWLAHVYAHALGQSVSRGERLSFAELWDVARHEGAIVEAALPPVVPLLLAALGVISTVAAVWAAFGLGLLVLAVQGWEFARAERLGWLGTSAAVAANLGFGLLLVGIKLVLTH